MGPENLEREQYFATRHARPARDAKEGDPVSKDYPDLTEQGVEQARERAREDIFKLIKDAPEGAVIFIGGTSDQPRTKQTAEIYGDTLASMKGEIESEQVSVVTKSDIDAMVSDRVGKEPVAEARQEKAFLPGQIIKVVESLRAKLDESPDRKVVIDYPIMLEELAYKYRNRWTDQKGNKTEYFTEVLKKHGQNHAAAGEDWLANQGRLEVGGRTIQGPEPREVAEDYMHGLQRLRSFVQKNAPGRPIVVGEVGHQWDMDAMVTYLGNRRAVNYEGYKKISQAEGIMQEAEMTEILIDPSGSDVSYVEYRGNRFQIFGIT